MADRLLMLEAITGLKLPAAVVSDRYQDALGDLTDLEDIIRHLEASDAPDIVIIDVLEDGSPLLKYAWPTKSPNLFALWVVPIAMEAHATLSQHMPRIRESLARNRESTTAIYIAGNRQMGHPYSAKLACFQKVHSTIKTYNEFPLGEEQRTCIRNYRRRRDLAHPDSPRKRTSQRLWSIALASLLIFLVVVILVTLVSTGTSPSQPWIAFPTPDSSSGPRHQLILTSANVTSWTTHHDPSHWHLRLDDQAMMPAALVDARERTVQAWFGDNFPHLRHNRDSGRYLDAAFLARAEQTRLDQKYHVAHCVAAFRRYLTAVETGRHVCPRDLSLGHLKHCARQLEDFAFLPKGEWYPEREVMLKWHTDVCF